MTKWLFGAITLTCLSIGGAAAACPVGVGQAPVRPRPVVRSDLSSTQASEMLERASRLETVAGSHETQARAFEAQADTLSNRARILREQAALVNVSDRSSILEIADELAGRARSERARAAGERAQARELRLEAQNLRQRAVVLVRGGGGSGGGGGWRGRDVRVLPSTPLPAERAVTL